MTLRTTALTAFLAATGFFLTIFALSDLGLGTDPSVVAVLALAAFVAEVFGGRLTGRIEVSASGFLAILAAVICGPAAAAITGLVAATVELRGGPRAKWLAFSGLYAIEGVVAGYAAHSDSSLAARTTIAALALFAVNLAGMSLVVVARRITPLGGQIRITAVADSVGAVLAVPIVMGLAYGYRLAGIGSLLLVLAPGAGRAPAAAPLPRDRRPLDAPLRGQHDLRPLPGAGARRAGRAHRRPLGRRRRLRP